MSRHRTAMARTAKKIRCQSVDGDAHSHHGSGFVDAVHVVSPPRRMDGLARLSSLRMICKAASCDKRLCMIDVGHVAIGHVSGSDQVGRVLHEVINICILGERLRESCTLCRESEVSVAKCVLSF